MVAGSRWAVGGREHVVCRDRARLGQTGHRVAGLCVSRAADKGGAEAEVVGIDGLVDRAVLDAGLRNDHLLASVDQVVRLDGEGGGGLTEVEAVHCEPQSGSHL